MEIITQVCGWLGMIALLVAYGLNSNKRVTAESATYQLLNLFGVIGVGFNVLYQHAWPALALQVIWGLIAVVALYKIWRK